MPICLIDALLSFIKAGLFDIVKSSRNDTEDAKECLRLLLIRHITFIRENHAEKSWNIFQDAIKKKGFILEEGDLIMGKKVVIETDECIGCESCVELCPDVFEFEEEAEKAHVKLPEGGEEECIEEAISTCPVECIHWEEV